MKLKELKGKNVTVVGLGRSGLGAVTLLTELGARVAVTDTRSEAELKDFVAKLNPSAERAFGSHPDELFIKADMLVVSPGVPMDIPPLLKAEERGIPVIGELELAYQVIGSRQSAVTGRMQFLAVTGTNGKSTTASLVDFMVRKSGFRTILGGNIGNALTGEILKISGDKNNVSRQPTAIDYIVVEVSSFQLESIKEFRPKVSAILNITPDHLDRYHSMEDYGDAKARIFENQKKGDFLVLNRDDPETMRVENVKLTVKSEKPEIFHFSRKREVEGIYLRDGIMYCNISDLPVTPLPFPMMRADEIKIKGVHNLENAMAASAMALLAGCRIGAVTDSLREFPGLEHRLEFVRELNGVEYFNDSKGTNVDAVMKSLESFTGPVILIAGGRDKAGNFSLLRRLVKKRVKALVLIGEASEKIRKALGDLTETVTSRDLREAVYASRDIAEEGDVVLLSPACASFDMFQNFEDRGRQFKKIVAEM